MGVVPDDLAYPDRRSKAWVPMQIPPRRATTWLSSTLWHCSRRAQRPGRRQKRQQSARTAPGAGLTAVAIFGADGPITVSARPLGEAITADVRQPILVLLAAVALLLGTTMTNVAERTARALPARLRELAIRAALGAGTARVVRQSMLEMLLLAALGSIAGLVLVATLHRLVPTAARRLSAHGRPAPRLRRGGVRRGRHGAGGHRLWADTGAAHPPARSRRSLAVQFDASRGRRQLANGARSTAPDGRPGCGVAAARRRGAALGRSFVGMLQADRGFDPGGVLTARLPLPEGLYGGTPAPCPREGAGTPRPNAGNRAGGIHLRNAARGGSTSAFTFRRPDDGTTIQAQASPRRERPLLRRAQDANRGRTRFARSDSAGEHLSL